MFAAFGFLLGMMPRWAWLGLAALVLAGSHLKAYLSGREDGGASVRAEWRAADDRQREVDAAERKRLQAITTEVAHDHAKTAARARADAAAARTELDRLRDAVAQARPAEDDPAAAREPDGVTPQERVFLECAADLQAVAADAESYAGRLLGLQAWVAGVCVTP